MSMYDPRIVKPTMCVITITADPEKFESVDQMNSIVGKYLIKALTELKFNKDHKKGKFTVESFARRGRTTNNLRKKYGLPYEPEKSTTCEFLAESPPEICSECISTTD